MGALSTLILNSIPEPSKEEGGRSFPESISKHVIHAFANVLYVHAHMSKEIASTAALYCTSAGFMASTHGVSHSDRALLALMLEERYEGELPPREADFKLSLQSILTPEEVWWTRYMGSIGLLISKVKDDAMMLREALDDHVSDIDKVGKHKNWIGGRDGWGMSIDIKIKEVAKLD